MSAAVSVSTPSMMDSQEGEAGHRGTSCRNLKCHLGFREVQMISHDSCGQRTGAERMENKQHAWEYESATTSVAGTLRSEWEYTAIRHAIASGGKNVGADELESSRVRDEMRGMVYINLRGRINRLYMGGVASIECCKSRALRPRLALLAELDEN